MDRSGVQFQMLGTLLLRANGRLFQASSPLLELPLFFLEWEWLTLGSHSLRECNGLFAFFLLLHSLYIYSVEEEFFMSARNVIASFISRLS